MRDTYGFPHRAGRGNKCRRSGCSFPLTALALQVYDRIKEDIKKSLTPGKTSGTIIYKLRVE